LIKSFADPNDQRITQHDAEGLFYTPLSTNGHRRNGGRERLLDVADRLPHLLKIHLNVLATRVLLDRQNRAVGVEYKRGARLYRAHRLPASGDAETCVLRATKEVILAGGAFNSPQLLMLSGIGPADMLRQHGIEVKVDLPGVGKNLQDRYEVGVVNRMAFPEWKSLQGASFEHGDPQYVEWLKHRQGMYISNGAGLTVAARSDPAKPLPDLFCMALLGMFKGYFPGYSRAIAEQRNYLTWSILKAHTNNRAGEVTLRSVNPCEPPAINFRYFEEGSDASGDDLRAVIAGIRFARSMTAKLQSEGLIAAEELPGPDLQSDDELAQFVRDHAWGHHACGTCAIGSVLDTDFHVQGTDGLRVVDASVFPRIPGYFIASAVYMIGEKAADVILAG
jgi:choline dehydrogenase-like flavoprotein